MAHQFLDGNRSNGLRGAGVGGAAATLRTLRGAVGETHHSAWHAYRGVTPTLGNRPKNCCVCSPHRLPRLKHAAARNIGMWRRPGAERSQGRSSHFLGSAPRSSQQIIRQGCGRALPLLVIVYRLSKQAMETWSNHYCGRAFSVKYITMSVTIPSARLNHRRTIAPYLFCCVLLSRVLRKSTPTTSTLKRKKEGEICKPEWTLCGVSWNMTSRYVGVVAGSQDCSRLMRHTQLIRIGVRISSVFLKSCVWTVATSDTRLSRKSSTLSRVGLIYTSHVANQCFYQCCLVQ